MQVLLLGPAAIVDGDVEHPIRSRRQAALLALLSLHGNRVVPTEWLVDALWEETPPRTARNTLQVHVSALRRVMGRDVIESAPDGYTFISPDGRCDVDEFEDLVKRAENACGEARWQMASRLFNASLALWRGPAFAGLAGGWLEARRASLERRRLDALRGRFESELEVGGHLGALPDLLQLSAEHPYDEALASLLMLAQYRAGRADEALRSYQDVRRRLVDDLGVEPGDRLGALHCAILRRDPELELDPRRSVVPVRSSLRPTSPLVGRQADLAALEAHLAARPGPTTLVGPSGVGKSRLAAELARRLQAHFSDGVAIVDVEMAPCPDDLEARIVDTLGLAHRGEPAVALATAQALVVLDGVRVDHPSHTHLVRLVDEMGVSVLATAHRPCGWVHEHLHPVRPLSLERPGEQGAEALSPAAELLVQRAASAGASVEGALEDAEACAGLLEGMPLALELAAPRAVLGFDELRSGLERERRAGHLGVRVSYAASVRGRGEDEQDLLQVLARCSGPVDGDWLRQLPRRDPESTMEALAALVRDGLARQDKGSHGYPVYELLSGVRPEVLDVDDVDPRAEALQRQVVATHAAWLTRPGVPLSSLDSAPFSRRVRALLDAAEGALASGVALGMHAEALGIAHTLNEHCLVVRTGVLGMAWQALSSPESLARLGAEDRVRALDGACMWADSEGRPEEMKALGEAAIAEARRVGDPALVAGCVASHSVGCQIHGLEAGEDLEEALRLVDGAHPISVASVWQHVGIIRGDGLVRRSVDLARSIGHEGILTIGLANLAEARIIGGDATGSAQLASEAASRFAAMHLGLYLEYARATLATASALAGSAQDLAGVAEATENAWRCDDLRSLTDGLLKLAAGLRATGQETASAQALSLFWNRVATHGLQPTNDDLAFLETWLPDVVPLDLDRPFPDALDTALAAARQGTAGAEGDRPGIVR